MDHTGLENWQEDINDPNWKHSAESKPVKNSKQRAKGACMCLLDTDILIKKSVYVHKLKYVKDGGNFGSLLYWSNLLSASALWDSASDLNEHRMGLLASAFEMPLSISFLPIFCILPSHY